MKETVTAEEYEKRSRVWFGEGKAYDHLPRRQKDRWIVLHTLASSLPPDRTLNEKEIDAAIRAWLEGQGKTFFVDHVSLRRELVDGGFLERDAAGRAYTRSEAYRRRQDLLESA